jgi:vitamin B12 transporter
MTKILLFSVCRIHFLRSAFCLFLLTACFFPAASLVSAASLPSVPLEGIVVTADKIDESAEEATSSVTVIKGEDIKKMNVQFVTDVLRKMPDLNLAQNGGAGKVATVFLRGGDSTHTLVMIDGVRVNSTTTGSYDFSGLTVDDIERIEIVKGPQSTIYGSEAMAGVINIITKKGEGRPMADLSFEGGSFGTYNPSISVSGKYKNSDYRITGSHFGTDGISAARSGTERDGYRNSAISGKFGIKPSENLEFEVTGKYYYDRTDLDGFDFAKLQAVDDTDFVQRGTHYLVSGKGKLYLFNIWEQIITLSSTGDSLQFRDPDTFFNNFQINTRMETVDWQNNLYLSEHYIMTAGAEYRTEKAENVGNFDKSLYNKALYLNNKLKLLQDDLVFNAGLRYDDHETFGDKVTYRAGAMYNIKAIDLRIRGSYGTGFRAPTFNELFFPFFGNTHLKPEESTSWEIGLEKVIIRNKVSLYLTYFDQDYKNLIQTDPLTFTAANIANAEIKGVETAAVLKITDNLNIKAGYTYLNAKDESTGQQLTRRPKDKIGVSADFSVKDFSFVANYIFVGKRFDSSVQRDLSSYSLVNLSGSYKANKWMTLFARIDNLFDARYEEIGSYGTPGFSVFGGVRISTL